MKFVRHLIVRFSTKSHKLSDYKLSDVYFKCALSSLCQTSINSQISGIIMLFSIVEEYQIKQIIHEQIIHKQIIHEQIHNKRRSMKVIHLDT